MVIKRDMSIRMRIKSPACDSLLLIIENGFLPWENSDLDDLGGIYRTLASSCRNSLTYLQHFWFGPSRLLLAELSRSAVWVVHHRYLGVLDIHRMSPNSLRKAAPKHKSEEFFFHVQIHLLLLSVIKCQALRLFLRPFRNAKVSTILENVNTIRADSFDPRLCPSAKMFCLCFVMPPRSCGDMCGGPATKMTFHKQPRGGTGFFISSSSFIRILFHFFFNWSVVVAFVVLSSVVKCEEVTIKGSWTVCLTYPSSTFATSGFASYFSLIQSLTKRQINIGGLQLGGGGKGKEGQENTPASGNRNGTNGNDNAGLSIGGLTLGGPGGGITFTGNGQKGQQGEGQAQAAESQKGEQAAKGGGQAAAGNATEPAAETQKPGEGQAQASEGQAQTPKGEQGAKGEGQGQAGEGQPNANSTKGASGTEKQGEPQAQLEGQKQGEGQVQAAEGQAAAGNATEGEGGQKEGEQQGGEQQSPKGEKANETQGTEGQAAKGEANGNLAVEQSEQFSEGFGITLDQNGNTANSGGNLGITQGTDGSQSVGGENGINIAANGEATIAGNERDVIVSDNFRRGCSCYSKGLEMLIDLLRSGSARGEYAKLDHRASDWFCVQVQRGKPAVSQRVSRTFPRLGRTYPRVRLSPLPVFVYWNVPKVMKEAAEPGICILERYVIKSSSKTSQSTADMGLKGDSGCNSFENMGLYLKFYVAAR
ncbi:uncharacterized protein BDR25DRAFT_362965 [Lindgomyces ingoldianus]|uniref:Uncharacterized protein n=1 Tax=Lindgomyces ingoldianus TaxID=673940 RepID=A0ACB6Q8M7_9PLEO|nr:uncharacterized protein BDR25DRAFT_362965 [Lindgomyces ingoldianus]KAF2463241.1 hypothetical protein BDR25DRAFT_362965 [Lindgomyces ingoldianus]